jgi:hypothetical protein
MIIPVERTFTDTAEPRASSTASPRPSEEVCQGMALKHCMARHRRFSLVFKRQVVLDFLEQRMGLRELAGKHSLSRNLLRQRVGAWSVHRLPKPVTPKNLASTRCFSRECPQTAHLCGRCRSRVI